MQIFGTPVKEDMDVDAGHPSEVGAIHIRPDERQRINFWHMDHSFRDPADTRLALYARLLPPVGGDTLFTSLEAAYDGLSKRMKSAVEGSLLSPGDDHSKHQTPTYQGRSGSNGQGAARCPSFGLSQSRQWPEGSSL